MIWCRDAENNWKTELQQGILPEIRRNFSFELNELNSKQYTSAKMYDPWNDKWTEIQLEDGNITLPPFLRSAVVIFN